MAFDAKSSHNSGHASIDFSHLSHEERLDLIGELWDSLDPDAAFVTPAQEIEIGRRLNALDEDIAAGRNESEDVPQSSTGSSLLSRSRSLAT